MYFYKKEMKLFFVIVHIYFIYLYLRMCIDNILYVLSYEILSDIYKC